MATDKEKIVARMAQFQKLGDTIEKTQDPVSGIENKVDKIAGKGLSTNDYTTAEKNKLSGIEAGADATTADKVRTILYTASTAEISNSAYMVYLASDGITWGKSSWSNLKATITKSDIGLGNVDNTSDTNKPISTAVQNALNLKENTISAGLLTQYYRGDKSWQTLDKSTVGLGNVTNDSQVKRAEMGVASGVATLNSEGKIPSSQISGVFTASDISNTPYGGIAATTVQAAINELDSEKSGKFGEITDANNATSTGFYTCSGTNCPNSKGGDIIVIAYNSLWCHQIYTEYGGLYQGRVFHRQMNNGTWQDWYQSWDSRKTDDVSSWNKTTLANLDLLGLADSADSYLFKKISWEAVKTVIKTWALGTDTDFVARYARRLYNTAGTYWYTASAFGVLANANTWIGVQTFSENIVGNITGNAATAESAEYSGCIAFKNTRYTNHNPFDYLGLTLHLKANSTDGLSDGSVYHGVMNLTQWSDPSGGCVHQLGFTDNHQIWHRHGLSSWGGWKLLIDSNNISSYAVTGTVGNAQGNIPISNGSPCIYLRAQYADNVLNAAENGWLRSAIVATASTLVERDSTGSITAQYFKGYLHSYDNRNNNFAPIGYSPGILLEFKANSTDGLTAGGGFYHGVLSFRPYGPSADDFSGGPMHQLGFTENGTIYKRWGSTASGWSAWNELIHSTGGQTINGTLGVRSISMTTTSENTGTAYTLSSSYDTFILTLTGNCTVTMPTGEAGSSRMLTVMLINDSTAGRTITFSGVKWSGGVAPSRDTTASAVNIYQFINNGTTWYGFLVGVKMS